MLHNLNPVELNHLQNSNFEFFLTGSRFFLKTLRKESDWDFYAEYSPLVEDYLKGQGYTVSLEYEDYFTVKVLTRRTLGFKIDVQLVQNVDLKTRAQRLLAPYINSVSKEYHKVLWDMAFKWLQSN